MLNAWTTTPLPVGSGPKLYAIRVTHVNGPADPQLAAALEEVYAASARDPESWLNNPAKQREAREGLLELHRRMAG